MQTDDLSGDAALDALGAMVSAMPAAPQTPEPGTITYEQAVKGLVGALERFKQAVSACHYFEQVVNGTVETPSVVFSIPSVFDSRQVANAAVPIAQTARREFSTIDAAKGFTQQFMQLPKAWAVDEYKCSLQEIQRFLQVILQAQAGAAA